MKLIADFIISMMQALLNYFESEKLLYLPPPQQMLIFWFKDNPGRISTTRKQLFFFLFYVILRWLSQSYEHAHFIETSGQQGFILPRWGVACYSEGFTSPWTVYRASNEARDIHWKHLRVSHAALTSCSDLHFNIQFIESAHFFIPLYEYLGCL